MRKEGGKVAASPTCLGSAGNFTDEQRIEWDPEVDTEFFHCEEKAHSEL